MPTPYHTLSDDTLNLLAERGNAQALMELAHRAERLGILAEARELANRLREGSKKEQEESLPANRCWLCYKSDAPKATRELRALGYYIGPKEAGYAHIACITRRERKLRSAGFPTHQREDNGDD